MAPPQIARATRAGVTRAALVATALCGAAFASPARGQCSLVATFQNRPVLGGFGEPPTSIDVPGGVHWSLRPTGSDCTRVRDVDETPQELAVVHLGPHFVGWRIQTNVAPGGSVSAACIDGSHLDDVAIGAGDPQQPSAPPTLGAVHAELVTDVEVLGCHDTPDLLPPPRGKVSHTLVDVDVTPDVDAFVDAWLVAPGAAVADDGSERAADMLHLGVADGVLAFAVADPGKFDLVVRTVDPASGAVSDEVRVGIDTPDIVDAGCASTAASSTTPFAALLGLSLRRRRRQCGSIRKITTPVTLT